MSTFSSVVVQRHFAQPDADGAESINPDAPIGWPSPGTLFATATLDRRAPEPEVSPAARRSVVAVGPGVLRSVLQRTGGFADAAPADGTTVGLPTPATIGGAVGRPRSERQPAPSTATATALLGDARTAAKRADVTSDVASVGPVGVRAATLSREQVAERFLTELSRGERRQPQPLPDPYRPMAAAITGHHRVLISTDDASRRALRAVNKVAATTGDVIHLAAPPAVGPRHTELLAHELTHVAHPSPAPRFFADDDRGPEERRADEIARVIARSPLAPTASIGRRDSTTSSARADPTHVIRRSPASRSTPARSSGGTLSAAALAEQITSGAWRSASPTETIRRADTVVPQAPPTNGSTTLSSTAPPVPGTDRTSPSTEAFWQQVESTEAGSDWFRRQLQANFDRIVRLLEHHMIGELERRGGRTWKGY